MSKARNQQASAVRKMYDDDDDDDDDNDSSSDNGSPSSSSAAAAVDDNCDDSSHGSGSSDKYPRTPHFPFSPGVNSDDVQSKSVPDAFTGSHEICITEKLDGGNCCLARGMVFARTHSKPASHESFGPVKQFYHTVVIPLLTEREYDMLELYGENMVMVHSINYSDSSHPLPAPFFLFAVRDRSRDVWLGVDQVAALAARLSLEMPEVLWRGVPANNQQVANIIQNAMLQPSPLALKMGKPGVVPVEGFVARVSCAFRSQDFERCVHKCVRPNHIQIEGDKAHWKRSHFL